MGGVEFSGLEDDSLDRMGAEDAGDVENCALLRMGTAILSAAIRTAFVHMSVLITPRLTLFRCSCPAGAIQSRPQNSRTGAALSIFRPVRN